MRDDSPVALDVLTPEVLEQAAPAADHPQQPSPGVVVLRVGLEVLGELRDALGEHGDLNLGRARVARAPSVLGNYLILFGPQ